MAVYSTRRTADGATVRFDDALSCPEAPDTHERTGEVAERIRLKCITAYEMAWTERLREDMLAHMTRHIADPEERERVRQRIRELTPELPVAPSGADTDSAPDIAALYRLASDRR